MIVEVMIEDEGWSRLGDATAFVARAADAALRGTGRTLPPDAELSVLLAGDGAVRTLNRDFRGKDAPTNVLSFPPAEGPMEHGLVGDLALAYATVAREAGEQDKTFDEHAAHLIVHGILHLLGYDHQNDADAERMETLERHILAGIGIADPYAAPLGADTAT